MVEDNLDEYERGQNTEKFVAWANRYPAAQRYMVANPRAAATAQDDHKSLGLLGEAWEVLKAIPRASGAALGAGTYRAAAGLREFTDAVSSVGEAITYPIEAAVATLGNMTGAFNYDPDKTNEIFANRRAAGRQQLRDEASRIALGIDTGNKYVDMTVQGLQSVPVTLAAALTRNPRMIAGIPAMSVAGNEYSEARSMGKDVLTSVRYGGMQGITEYITEKIPAQGLVDIIAKGTPFGKAFISQLATEIPGEQLSTVMQDFTSWAFLNPEKTLGNFIAERPEAALSTLLGTIGGTGAQTGAISAVRRAGDVSVKISDKVRQSRIARAESGAIDRMGKAAEGSATRQRDPEAYDELTRALAEDAGASHVFIPGEAAREYMQSDSYDPDSDPMQSWASAIDEAANSGGDLVLPVEFATGQLPGTPAWAALKDYMRLTSGGQSLVEAQDFEASIDDVMTQMSDQMDQEESATAKQRSALETLTDKIAAKLGTSYTAPAARAMATVEAMYHATRAQMQGRELTGNEADNIEVRQVMPEALARAIQPALGKPAEVDTATREIIRAIRGKIAKPKTGKSLIDWITAKGGIEDRGGDIASMGGGKVKGIAKKGQRKLIKPHSDGDMLGDNAYNPNTLEAMFDAAISDGYFPDLLAQREGDGTYADKMDTGAFLAAISEGLAGRHSFSIDAVPGAKEEIQAAADELRQLLQEAGYDPDNMADGDIRDAMNQLYQSQDGGFEQLGDSIDIDGVQRSTRNSEGQPIAGTEAGVRAFWKWFGESKVVDAGGRPLVVYHGSASQSGVDAFDAGKIGSANDAGFLGKGFYFTPDAQLAQDYVPNKGGKVEPVYLAISNPFVWDLSSPEMESETISAVHEVWPDGGENGVTTTGILRARQDGRASAFTVALTDAGYNGLIEVDGDMVVFDPTQIKSINNRGTFDPADPRILFQSLFDDPAQPERTMTQEQRAEMEARLKQAMIRRGGQKAVSDQDGGLFDAARDQGALFQEARGSIQFDQGKSLIQLFQSRNLSTYFHEFGHLTLENLAADAALPDAPDGTKTGWQTVQDWFKANGHPIGEDGAIPVEAHELWARGVERYMMEGKAPSQGLARVFEMVKGWMKSIYKSVDQLRSPITPEIREVMDRLFATDEEITAAREQQSLAALSGLDALMSKSEAAAYGTQVADARAEAHSKLVDKTMAALRRRATKEYQDMRSGVRDDVEADVNALPVFRALRNLKTSPMDAGWIREEMGEEALSLLPRRVPPLARDKGADPSLIAEMSGFATGRQMIEALVAAELAQRQAKESGDPRPMRTRIIETATDAEMDRRVGDTLNDGSIEREALAAVHGDMQGEVIASEARILGRRSGKRATPYSLAKAWARNRVRSGAVNDDASPSAIQRHARNAAKAARAAEAAMLGQDVDEAFRQKQFQMLNNALLSEAKAAHDEVQAAVKRMERIARAKTMKSVDQDYLEQAQALLEVVDLRKRSQVGIDRQGLWEEWSSERQAEGHDIVVPPSFEATLGKTNWSRLPVSDLLALDVTIKQIVHLGRFKQSLLDGKERRDFDEVVGEAVSGMDGMNRKPPSDLMEPSGWDAIKSKVSSLDAALLKMETVFDWLDQGNSNGVFNRLVFRPLADAQENARVRMNDVIGKLSAALDAIPAKTLRRWNQKFSSPELLNQKTGNPFVFTRAQLVSMGLNMGNEGNARKLAGGYGWNESDISAVLDRELSAEEWTYVQQVWTTINSLWPEIEALERRVNGVAPEKIEARRLDTPFFPLDGGYFPVVYDPRRNYQVEKQSEALFSPSYTRSTTPRGFTKERTKVERPIHLSLNIITRHVAEVIHDITHREAIMQADKFLSSSKIMQAVDETLGPEIRQAFRPWLQRIANQWAYDRAGMAGVEGFLNKMRLNATVVGMGFRVSTALVQAAGYTSSFEVVGERWVAPRIKDVANPAAWKFVFERSKEVEGRMQSLDRDIADAARRASGGVNLSAATQFAFHGIGYMDRVVVIPTWLGAYDKALAAGLADEDAVYAADKAVRQSQGSGAAKDLAAIQAGRGVAGALGKYLTMFYSFMSAQYQRQRTLGRDIGAAKARDVPRLIARTWWMLIAGPVLAELLAKRGPGDDDDDETWASWAMELTAKQFMGPIPIARDVVPVLISKAKDKPTFGYRFTPAQGGIETLIRVGEDAERVVEGEETKRATRNLIELVGYTTGNGLATGQVATATQFLVDVGSGDADPEGFWDWYEGLTKGKLKD